MMGTKGTSKGSVRPAVAEICFSKAWGGLEHRYSEEALWLTQRGHRVIAVVYPATPLERRLRQAGLQPVVMRARTYFDPIATLRLAALFRRNRVVAAHVHRSHDVAPMLAAADLAGVARRVLTIRQESRWRKKDIYHRWVYSRLTSVIALTERMKRLVGENVAVSPDRVCVVRNGYDLERMRAEAELRDVIRARWGVPQDAFVVGIVGRLQRGKGQGIVLTAGSSLVGSIPNLFLMIVGADTPEEPGETDRLKRLAEQLGIGKRTVFTGYLSPPGVIVPAFDVSVLATKKETFGNVTVEAMALGVPAIATDAGGMPEIIDHGTSGLLVPPEDPDALAQAVLKLSREPDTRRRFSEAGPITVGARFSLESHIAGVERELGI